MFAQLICSTNNMKFKRVRSLEQYNEYCNLYEDLIMKSKTKDSEEIDLLELLIEDYDNRVIEAIGIKEDMTPVELLRYLLEENNLTKAELARELGVSRQLITEILNYKRNISKKMITKLSDRFKMQPIAFSREYELKGERSAA